MVRSYKILVEFGNESKRNIVAGNQRPEEYTLII